MAITAISGALVFYGLSTDDKATATGAVVGSLFIETDTGLEYSYNGAAWFQRKQIAQTPTGGNAMAVFQDEDLSGIVQNMRTLSGVNATKQVVLFGGDVGWRNITILPLSPLVVASDDSVLMMLVNSADNQEDVLFNGGQIVDTGDGAAMYMLPINQRVTINFNTDILRLAFIEGFTTTAPTTGLTVNYNLGRAEE